MNDHHDGRRAKGTLKGPFQGCAGFTIMEVLVAISLLSIISGMTYSFYLFAHKQVLAREVRAFEFDNTLSLIESISANIRESRTTLLLDESSWFFLTKQGDTASYVFADGKLTFNKVALTIGGKPIGLVSFSCMGNDSLLDANGGGEAGVFEIDANGDGKISGTEVGKIAWIRVAISLREEDGPTFETVESVKNNCMDDAEGFLTYF